MPQYMRRARGGKWSATPLSGVGYIDPATIAFFAQATKSASEEGGGTFDIFGPTAAFQSRQAVREEYQSLADNIRRLAPTLSGAVRNAVDLYLGHISGVIARGATAADLAELKEKSAEWEAMMGVSIPVSVAPTGFELAGFPWYVWALGLGVLLPLILKRK